MAALPSLVRVFGDPTRLRILGLLEGQELSAGELARALGMAQSRVSNHLRILREAHLLRDRHEGTSIHLRSALAPDAAPNGEAPVARRLWDALRDELDALPEHALDVARLEEVLAARRPTSGSFFDRVASHWETLGERFRSGQGRQRVAAQLLSGERVLADLGCGTGYFAESLVGLCGRLILVDASARMLEQAERRLAPSATGTRIEARVGELDRLPIADGELDGAVAGMVLHHLPALDAALAEIRRALRPGGRLVVLELAPHREQWMREALGDRHLGLEPALVLDALRAAAFGDLAMETIDDRYCPEPPAGGDESPALPLYSIRGRAPEAPRPTISTTFPSTRTTAR